jgi:putative aldouronate transport system substrate-binding protein
MVPATAKNPALLMRFVDYFHNTTDGTKVLTLGVKGVGWTDPDPDGVGADGKPAAYKMIELKPDDPRYNRIGWDQLWPHYAAASEWGTVQGPANILASDGSGLNGFLYQKTQQNYAPYGNASLVVPPLWYSMDEASEMSLLTTNINTYVEESIAKFVVGDIDPNRAADWNNFQTQLRNLGIERYLAIIQKTYDGSAFAKK